MAPDPFLPYGRHNVGRDDVEAVLAVLESDWLTQGPTVARFEEALAERCGARYAVAVSSGTAALHIAALAAGFGPGDRVLTSPNTFVATALAATYTGAEPGFVDIDPATLNLDPRDLTRQLETEDGRRVRGVIPVHFAGLPADMEAIRETAGGRGVTIIEDACHAIGASWTDRDGRTHRVGSCSHSDMAVFSFHPVKHLTTAEGGAVLTNDSELSARLRRLRTHGIERDPAQMERHDGPWYYEMQELGFNYRLSDLQAALGLAQLARLDRWIARRAELVESYRSAFCGDPRIAWTRTTAGDSPAWHLFVVRIPERDRVYARLREAGIGVQVHYIPVHLQPFFRKRYGTGDGDCPECEAYYREALSLPLFPAMTGRDVRRVVEEIRRGLDREGGVAAVS